MTQLIPGWYPDPTNPLQERLWDGSEWVDKVRPRAPQVDAMPADDPVVVGDASPRTEKGIEVRYKRPWRVTRLFGIIADRAGVMFLVPFFSALVAVVLGHIVLLQTTDKAHLRGRSKALFGVVVGWMTVAVYIFSSLYYGW